MYRKIIWVLNVLCFVSSTSCSIITDSSDLMGTGEPKEQDDSISGLDAATTTNRGFEAENGVFTSDVESGQKIENPDTVVDAAIVDSTGIDAAMLDTTVLDAAVMYSSAGSDGSADKKDQGKPTFCQSDDICHGKCNQENGTCTCENERMTSDCSACASGYTPHPECDDPVDKYFDWVTIPGGTFMMGSAEGTGNDEEHPQHEVTVQTYKMSKTEVTVEQYRLCVDANICSEPYADGEEANWGKSGREKHPVNFVSWNDAVDFADWLGGRLPSEADWEYAARSGGKDYQYPWGNEYATCEHAVIWADDRGNYCGNESTKEVCSKNLGNTDQKLCDMAGNVYEWVEDDWHDNYYGAPTNGKAWVDNPRSDFRILRGGSWDSVPYGCRSVACLRGGPHGRDDVFGFRVVLDIK